MTKQEWMRHHEEKGDHSPAGCPECQARIKTRKANARAKYIRRVTSSVYESLGMVRVRGNLGGVYYE